MSTESVIKSFWGEMFQHEFNDKTLAETILWYMGFDGNRLSVDDVILALHSEDCAPWYLIGWACRESFLGFAPDRAESPENFIIYVTMTCLWSESIVRNELEWDSTADFCFQLVSLNLTHGSAYSRIRWFKHLFRESVK
jgi:hypothetical protein